MPALSEEETINYYLLLLSRFYRDPDRTIDPVEELERYKKEGGVSRIDFYNSTTIDILEKTIERYQNRVNAINNSREESSGER